VNTKRGLLQTILFCHTELGIPLNTREYLKQFNLLKIQSARQTAENRANPAMAVISFEEYLRRISDHYGENSKQMLVASLYYECTCRDNYGNIQIIASRNLNVEKNKNYIIVPALSSLIARKQVLVNSQNQYRLLCRPNCRRLLENT
jgi:mannose-1-phosphate guanylyltransferase